MSHPIQLRRRARQRAKRRREERERAFDRALDEAYPDGLPVPPIGPSLPSVGFDLGTADFLADRLPSVPVDYEG